MTATATHQATAELEGRAAAIMAAVHAIDATAAPETVESRWRPRRTSALNHASIWLRPDADPDGRLHGAVTDEAIRLFRPCGGRSM
jgi:hypothetical protein